VWIIKKFKQIKINEAVHSLKSNESALVMYLLAFKKELSL